MRLARLVSLPRYTRERESGLPGPWPQLPAESRATKSLATGAPELIFARFSLFLRTRNLYCHSANCVGT